MKIVAIGDSLTLGEIGYSYIPFLKKGRQIVNKGVNGDTTICAFRRLERIIKNPRYQAADTYIVGIGTNDILLPHLSTISALWNRQMKPRCKRKQCITNDDTFKKEYERYLTLLTEHNKKIILLGLPYIQLEDFPHEKIVRRNQIIKRLALKYKASFVDVRSIQLKILTKPKYYSWKRKNISRLVDSAIMAVLPFTKDYFGKKRELDITVDGVHFTSKSARAVARCVGLGIKD